MFSTPVELYNITFATMTAVWLLLRRENPVPRSSKHRSRKPRAHRGNPNAESRFGVCYFFENGKHHVATVERTEVDRKKSEKKKNMNIIN